MAAALALRVAGNAAGLSLIADRRRTKQMIINLLSNAIKFTHAGGRVELAAQRMADGAIAITVADTGIGMTRIRSRWRWNPSAASTSAAIKDPTGTGLGLPIVKNLIEAHGGRLQIRSQLKRGTVARLVFPAA